MREVMLGAWALLLGMFLLQIGNGMQGTLLGIRGGMEGIGATELSIVMAAYFAGFLGGSRLTPRLIRRVGHVRVYAALASLISAAFIIYAALPYGWAWTLMRLIVGFCFSGVYVVSESWLNNSASNENRGKALSLYIMVQMGGIILAQFMLNLADPNGYTLFVIISVLVSISFAPILLTVSPAPVFEQTKPMSLRQLYDTSPLGMVGMFLLGVIFSAMFSMSAVYGAAKGFSVREISLFVAAIYAGGLLCQYPIGWLSDRMDRRLLIAAATGAGALLMVLGILFSGNFTLLLLVAFALGGISNPLYSLLLAYTNDFLEYEDMASASGGLIFVNGVGAITGPLVLGWLMEVIGPDIFFAYMALIFALIAAYAGYRMTVRAAPSVEDTAAYAMVAPQASPVAVEVAQELAVEMAEASDEEAQGA